LIASVSSILNLRNVVPVSPRTKDKALVNSETRKSQKVVFFKRFNFPETRSVPRLQP
jgi:hypothetical protein